LVKIVKKILPYILIVLILVNLFAPIGIEINNKNISVKNNTASALTTLDGATEISQTSLNSNDQQLRTDAKSSCLTTGPEKEYCFKSRWVITGGKLFFSIYTVGVDRALDDDYTLTVKMINPDGTNFNPTNTDKTKTDTPLFNTRLAGSKAILDSFIITEDQGLTTSFTTDKYDGYLIKNKVGVSGLIANTAYTMNITLVKKGGIINVTQGGESLSFSNIQYSNTSTQTFSDSSTVSNNGKDNTKPQGAIPECSITSGEGIIGCGANLIYYVLFQPTSYLFALTGTFFDNTFAYSVNDATYRSAFVVQGWGIVRDFCNMFFIFILLYIAFSTILDLHGVKTKEMIISVVVIGIFINFSLFTTQIIIDASNIMARVFYNSDSIKITQAGGGTVESVGLVGADGVLPLSAALVNKVNPQSLIINSSKVSVIDDTKAKANGAVQTDPNIVSASTFILVTILATIVNLVGLVVFMSVGLIFVARVIGLWLAMIVVPFVFLSYTVPSLQDIDMVGWKKWWPETLKMAFLAPVFIFFLYLIIKFLDAGLSITQTNADTSLTGLKFVVSIIIPFAFIMIFLIKAKDIAKDMSGKLGQSITGAISTVGGLALGGAALGSAALLRNTIGTGLAAASKQESSVHLASQKMKYNQELETWKAKDPNTRGMAPKWSDFAPNHGDIIGQKKDKYGNIKTDSNGNPIDIKYNKFNPLTQLGGLLNAKQQEVSKIDKARNITEQTIEKVAPEFKGKKWSGLTDAQQKVVLDRVGKEDVSKHMNIAEDSYRSKVGNEHLQVKQPLTTAEKTTILDDETNKMRASKPVGYILTATDISAVQKLANERIDKENSQAGKLPSLSVSDKEAVKNDAIKRAEDKFKEEIGNATESVAGLTRAFTKANTGSWDVRNLSQISSHKHEGIFTKIPTALISGVALGVRTGLKNSGINHSTGQKDILKDISQTLKDSLAVMKIDLPKAPGGAGSAPKAGGGGGHH